MELNWTEFTPCPSLKTQTSRQPARNPLNNVLNAMPACTRHERQSVSFAAWRMRLGVGQWVEQRLRARLCAQASCVVSCVDVRAIKGSARPSHRSELSNERASERESAPALVMSVRYRSELARDQTIALLGIANREPATDQRLSPPMLGVQTCRR